MRQGHILGTTPPMDAVTMGMDDFTFSPENLRLMADAKLTMLRMFLSFPWQDETREALAERYQQDLAMVKECQRHGLEAMPAFPTAANWRYNPKTGRVDVIHGLPDWFGGYDEDRFYENVFELGKFLAEQTRGCGDIWQVANEPNIPIFIGDMTEEQIGRYLWTAALGIKAGNPDAKCCINLAAAYKPGDRELSGFTRALVERLYRPEDSPFDILALDGYFGSWEPGRPEDWEMYIDAAYAASGKPILINEWGYSTLQAGVPRPEGDKGRHFNSDVCREKSWDAPEHATNKWLGLPHSEQLQAEYVKIAVKIFADHPHVIGNLFFQWEDQPNCWQCGEPDCPSECGWGALHTDHTPKAGYYALAEAYRENFA